jgi:hypothetical protein
MYTHRFQYLTNNNKPNQKDKTLKQTQLKKSD